MTSSNTLLKKIIGVKDVVVTDAEIYSDHDGVTHLTIDACPNSWNQNKCPFCGRKKLPGYDRPSQSLRVWRGLDLGGVMVDISYIIIKQVHNPTPVLYSQKNL